MPPAVWVCQAAAQEGWEAVEDLPSASMPIPGRGGAWDRPGVYEKASQTKEPELVPRRGSFAPGGASRGHVIPRGGMQGGFGGQSRGSRPSDARFTRRY